MTERNHDPLADAARETFASLPGDSARPEQLSALLTAANRRRRGRDLLAVVGSTAAVAAIVTVVSLGLPGPGGSLGAPAASGASSATATATPSPGAPSLARPEPRPPATPVVTATAPDASAPAVETPAPSESGGPTDPSLVPDYLLPLTVFPGEGELGQGRSYVEGGPSLYVKQAPLVGFVMCNDVDPKDVVGAQVPIAGAGAMSYNLRSSNRTADIVIVGYPDAVKALEELRTNKGHCRWFGDPPRVGGWSGVDGFRVTGGTLFSERRSGAAIRVGSIIVTVTTTDSDQARGLADAQRLAQLTADRLIASGLPQAKD